MTTILNSRYQRTAINMVSLVENTINGYRMGPVRALAQEPVQNSKDAALTRNTSVTVVYQLHRRTMTDGSTAHMLTVTDTGTKGLGGPLLDPDELSAMGSVLEPGHDWTAFEGQGYTKRDEDALGSRGQGKAAFLYHSDPPNSPNDAKRMVIVYDTLLQDQEYRLGIRYANPIDRTQTPPFIGDPARDLISDSTFQIDHDLLFPISLEPLSEPGTRVIIPFLNPTTRDAIADGELEKWLQVIWWRAIQLKQLEIWVKTEHDSKRVEIPHWWREEPWDCNYDETELFVRENIAIPSDAEMRIKRLVLTCHEGIEEYAPLASTKESEFDGVQLFRGSQWIETLGRGETWHTSKIPAELRPRFRGFVEFDTKLDRELRDKRYESPQHDDFKRNSALVRDIVNQVERCVTEFSEIAGWSEQPDDSSTVERKHKQVFRQVMQMFTEPLIDGSGSANGQGKDTTPWRMELNATYPNPTSSRVNWGQALDDVTATCIATKENAFDTARIKLTAIGPDHRQVSVDEREVQLGEDGSTRAKFGVVPFLKGKGPTGTPYVGCEEPGRYRIQASVETLNKQAAKASRAVYVQVDPPEPPQKPLSVSLLAKNPADPDEKRLNANDDLMIDINIRNRDLHQKKLIVDASMIAAEVPGHLVAGDDTPSSVQLLIGYEVTVPGIERRGETATPIPVFKDTVRLLDDLPPSPITGFSIVLAPGAHKVQVDIRDEHGNPVASTSRTVWFQTNPPGTLEGGLPFDVQARSDKYGATGQADPDWWFEQEPGQERKTLLYSVNHPLFVAATKADVGTGRTNPGSRAYLANICSDALLDWMVEPFIDSNDESRFQALVSRSETDPRWVHLTELVEAYRDRCVESNGLHQFDLMQQRRRIIANMVRLFTEAT